MMFSSGPPVINYQNMPQPSRNPPVQLHGSQLLIRPRVLPPSALPPQVQYYPVPPNYYSVRPRLPSDVGSSSSLYHQAQPNFVEPRPVFLQQTQATQFYRLQVPSARATYPAFDQSQPGPSRSVPGGQFERQQGPYRNTPGPLDRSQPGFSRNASNGFDRPSRPFSCPFKSSVGPVDQFQPGSYRTTSWPINRPESEPVRPASGPFNPNPTQDSFDLSEPGPSRNTPGVRQRTPAISTFESVTRYQRITQSRDLRHDPMTSLAHSMSDSLIHAICERVNTETALFCPHCGEVPREPVTGPCGHTRCRMCVTEDGVCSCGQETTGTTVNILVQRIINSLSPRERFVRLLVGAADLRQQSDLETASASARRQISAPPSPSAHQPHRVPASCLRDYHMWEHATPGLSRVVDAHQGHQERYMYARDLVAAGYALQAVPHLAKAAAFGPLPLRTLAKDLLVKVLQMLYNDQQICQITSPLHTSLLYWCSIQWLGGGELDCILCCQVYRHPVTTPCGHTYCRPCIERSMDHKRLCPLCSSSLDDFNVAATADTSFIVQAIQAVGHSVEEVPEQDDRLPIFVCTVAYPTVPCPLYVFEPRYRLMIRRCMRSETRCFGMVYGRNGGYSDYGTILEIRDCILLPDGRSIITTMGISRFHILEKDRRDGYDVARVEPIYDYSLSGPVAHGFLYEQNKQTRCKAELWLNFMNPSARAVIEASFGPLPPPDNDGYYRPDGPAWMWWVLAVLPLRNEIKVMILSSLNLSKRLFAIERTLDLIESRSVLLPRAYNYNPVMPSAYVRENWRQRAG